MNYGMFVKGNQTGKGSDPLPESKSLQALKKAEEALSVLRAQYENRGEWYEGWATNAIPIIREAISEIEGRRPALPWRSDEDQQFKIYDSTGRCIADNLRPDDAHYIVVCCNTYGSDDWSRFIKGKLETELEYYKENQPYSLRDEGQNPNGDGERQT